MTALLERTYGRERTDSGGPPAPAPSFAQRSFDDLGTPLREVTFCVLDLETTGASPEGCEITEVGAIAVRGGECLGTFQTLVNPGLPIPPQITVLTGITDAMVVPAPPLEEVLPTFLEFLGRSVVVGHNVRFDLSFLRSACRRLGYRWPEVAVVDTVALARRLVREEVRDCRLGTLAAQLRLDHQPSHRALDDALATADLLHLLLERAGTMGVTALDDLLALPTIKGHPQQAKLKLTASLPRAPGVYLFRDRRGDVLYVGKAADLRSRVRSYFSGDDRRKVGRLIRETERIDHVVTSGRLEAAVLEVRLIHQLLPRYNRQSKTWSRYAYLKLTLDEPFPRLSVVRVPRDDGCLYLGPLPSQRAARRVAEAIQTAVPIRRCTGRIRPGVAVRSGRCAAAQLGVALCPCAGDLSPDLYAPVVERVRRGLVDDPCLLLDPLEERMRALAAAQRFEEAADVRERAAALASAVAKQRRLDALRRAGTLEVEVPGAEAAILRAGRLAAAWSLAGSGATARPLALGADDLAVPATGPLPREVVDEMACVARWLDDHADQVRVIEADRGLALPLPRLPRFEPAKAGGRARSHGG